MDRETVVKILLFCRDIDKEISLNKRISRDLELCYYNSIGSGTAFDGVTKSKYKITNLTESAALNIPDSVSAVMRILQKQNEQFYKLQNVILKEIDTLPYPQGDILLDFYIRGFQWIKISVKVNYGETQCKQIRNRALDNLIKLFSKNIMITNFLLEREW